jgi:hypothetical protein
MAGPKSSNGMAGLMPANGMAGPKSSNGMAGLMPANGMTGLMPAKLRPARAAASGRR